MLALASCSRDNDDMGVVPETPETVSTPETIDGPVSWRANAYRPEELQKVEDAIGAIRGAGYTYRDNTSYCVGTDMEVFNMRHLRDMERKYNTSYLIDDYKPVTAQNFFYSESEKGLKDSLAVDVGIGVYAGVFSVDVDVAFNKKNISK